MRLSPTSPRPDKLPECNETYEVRERNVNGIAEKRVTETDVPFVQSAHLSALQMVKQVLGGRAMGAGDDPNRVTCFKQALPFPRNVAQDGYLELVNAGQPQGDEALVVSDPTDPAQAVFYRSVQGVCVGANGAVPPNCSPMKLVEETALPTAFADDGVLRRYADSVKFGMMTLDDDPGPSRTWPRALGRNSSFGQDEIDNQATVNAAVGRFPNLLQEAFIVNRLSSPDSVRAPNLGARGPGDGQPGDLIASNAGSLVNGRPRPFEPITDENRSIERHTDYLRYQVQRLTPFGFSPLTAMVSDLAYYYQTQAGTAPERFGLLPDLDYQRRDHVAVLITSGVESNFYGSRNCLRTGLRCETPVAFPYEPMQSYVDAMREQVPGFKFYVIAIGGAEAQAEGLQALVANQGDFFVVNNAAELRSALTRVLTALDADRKSRVMPLVITPDGGDDVADHVRQLRVTAYSSLVEGSRYGRIDVSAFGCPRQAGEPPTGRLQPLPDETTDIAVKLAEQQERNAIGNSHSAVDNSGEPGFTLIGRGGALFSSDGQYRGAPTLDEAAFREVARIPAGNAGDSLMEVAFKALAGYIGPAAVPGTDGECLPACGPDRGRVRQLGEIVTGDLVAVTPPRLAVDSPAYRRFAAQHRDRPSMVVSGAQDGQVHFFRASDGREIFSFVHRRAMPHLKDGVENPAQMGADTLLTTREMLLCRSVDGDGGQSCPADSENYVFRTIVAGALGASGSNVFAIDVTEAGRFAKPDGQDDVIEHDTIKAWEVGSGFER